MTEGIGEEFSLFSKIFCVALLQMFVFTILSEF